jgi:hypothetical protein
MASFLLSYKKKILEVQKRALQVEETNARSRTMKVDAKLIIEETEIKIDDLSIMDLVQRV